MNKAKFSCSTMWNIRQHANAADALKEMTEMGFEQVELNYLVTEEHLKQMYPCLEKKLIGVSSVHNVFPKVKDNTYDTDSPLLGFIDNEKRKESVRLTKQTLDYTHKLGAQAVVMHVSVMELEKDYNHILKKMYEQGLRNSEEYRASLEEFFTEKNKVIDEALKRTANSLIEIADYRDKKNYKIKLGVENRSSIMQIPTFDEAHTLFSMVGDENTGLWYDIGHGIMCENLGALQVFPNVEALRDKLIGMHIHDAEGVYDHFEPYHFGSSFEKYIPLIKHAPIKVFEIGPKCGREAVENSLARVRNAVNV